MDSTQEEAFAASNVNPWLLLAKRPQEREGVHLKVQAVR